MGEVDQRALAIRKLQIVRQFAAQDREPCEVIPGLFIGPIGAARNLESLQKSGITYVLNASPVIPCFHKKYLRYKKVFVYDDPDEDISRYFDESIRFIHKARKKGGVLVHCFAGEGLDASAALNIIRKSRPSAQPNTGFMRQLRTYSQKLVGAGLFRTPSESMGDSA